MSNYHEPKNNESMYLGGDDWKQMWPKYDEENGLPSTKMFQPTFEDVFYSKGHSKTEDQDKVRKAFLDRLNGKEQPKTLAEQLSESVFTKDSTFTVTAKPAIERQVGGSHYKDKGSSMQPWAIIDAWGLDFYGGNVLKYILRAKHKGGLEDLQKARHYLDKMIEDADAS